MINTTILLIGLVLIALGIMGIVRPNPKHNQKKTNIIHDYSDRKVGAPISSHRDKTST